jgi:host factor-I protein
MAGQGRTKTVNKAEKSKPEKSRPDRARSAQDRFLTDLAQEHRKVLVFLTNGIKLEGEIKSFDDYAILIEGSMTDHVYKHAVSTIQPVTDVVSKARATARVRTPRASPSAEGYATEDAGVIAPGAKATEKEESPRQPVIVVRPRRRIVKTVAKEE